MFALLAPVSMLLARHVLQAILVNSGDTGPGLSMQIVCWWEVTLGACLDDACPVDRKEQILHQSLGHLGKCKSALPVKNHVRKYQPVSSHGACMDPDTPQFIQIRQPPPWGHPRQQCLPFETCRLSGGLFIMLCCVLAVQWSLAPSVVRRPWMAQAETRATPGLFMLQAFFFFFGGQNYIC